MPTNQEWLNQLATESPEKLKAWFDAEHNDDLAAEKVVGGDSAHSNDANAHLKDSENLTDAFSDSREQLEADVREWVDNIGWLSDKETQVADFIAWLDRQAAITAHANTELIEKQAKTIIHLQQKVDKLTEDYEASSRALEILTLDKAELKTQVDKLTAKRDSLRESSSDILDAAHEIERIINQFWD